MFGDAGASAGLSRIVRRAMLELGSEADGQEALVAHLATKAADYINGVRGYTATDANPVEAQYESVAVDMVVYSYAKRGAEGQTSHSENGVMRMYEGASAYPASLTSQIAPKVRTPAIPVTEEV